MIYSKDVAQGLFDCTLHIYKTLDPKKNSEPMEWVPNSAPLKCNENVEKRQHSER